MLFSLHYSWERNDTIVRSGTTVLDYKLCAIYANTHAHRIRDLSDRTGEYYIHII